MHINTQCKLRMDMRRNFSKKMSEVAKNRSRKATGNQHRGEARPRQVRDNRQTHVGPVPGLARYVFNKNTTSNKKKKAEQLQSRRHGRRCSGLGSFDFFSMLLLTKRHDHSAYLISCCLRKKFTQVALVWRCVSYLRDRRAQYGSVQQGSAKSCLCTKITQVNYTRQHK